MSWVALGVGVAGAAGSIASGAMQAGAANKANFTNSNLGINQMLLQLAQDRKTALNNVGLSAGARGAALEGPYVPAALKGTEHAVLPYFTGGTEARAGRDVAALYESGRIDPATLGADYGALLKKYSLLVSDAEKTQASLVTGDITDEMLRDARPVFETRMSVAKNSAMDALAKTLAHTDEIQAGRGFSGDSLNRNMVEFKARKAAGNDIGMAEMQNETDRQAIKNAGRQLRINNTGLPDQMAAGAINRKQLPAIGAASDMNNRLSAFNFFRMNPNNSVPIQSTRISLPEVKPMIPTGAVVASGLGAAIPELYSDFAKSEQGQKWGLSPKV